MSPMSVVEAVEVGTVEGEIKDVGVESLGTEEAGADEVETEEVGTEELETDELGTEGLETVAVGTEAIVTFATVPDPDTEVDGRNDFEAPGCPITTVEFTDSDPVAARDASRIRA